MTENQYNIERLELIERSKLPDSKSFLGRCELVIQKLCIVYTKLWLKVFFYPEENEHLEYN